MERLQRGMGFIYNMLKRVVWLELKGTRNIIKIFAPILFSVLEEDKVRNPRKYTNILSN